MTPGVSPAVEDGGVRSAVEHGGPRPAELRRWGRTPAELLDFSSNINPFGPHPAVVEAVRRVPLGVLPDPDCLELREALAARLGVPGPEWVVAGNGSSELIHLAVQALSRPGETAAVAQPTFGEYARASRAHGRRVERVWLGLDYRPDRLADLAHGQRPAVVFVCNPNNPTGTYWPRRWVEQLLAGMGPGQWLVLDEAFGGFVEGRWASEPLLESGRLVILRSLTKDHALAGLRLGYALAPPTAAREIERRRPAWSVSAPAQAAGLAALEHAGWLPGRLAELRRLAGSLRADLARLGVPSLDSAVHFFLALVGGAEALRRALLERGLLVRSGASFGLPGHVRIAARRREENERLVAVLEEVLR